MLHPLLCGCARWYAYCMHSCLSYRCHGTHALALPAGDGAGVGKGRTIAGLILENWRQGRHKHLWLSVGSDLKIDSQRDLNDVGGEFGKSARRVWQG